jgi:hypothetical protein
LAISPAFSYRHLTSIYLGNDLKDYTAHIVSMAIGYRF